MADDEKQKKQAELEAKKAEVRRRLEEAGQAGKKKKKGFLTPERKKKLRKLLMSKAAEDLKRQQLVKEQERQKALAQRIIALPNVDSVDDKGQLEKIYNDLFTRLCQLEEEKYDINCQVSGKESEINTLTISVNDLRGKFVKPSLKKVSKYDNKFKKAAAKEGEEPATGFAVNLKKTKKEGNVIDEILNKKKGMDGKPEWSKKDKKEKEEVDAEAAAAAPAPEQEEIEVPKADEPAEDAPEEEEEDGEEEEEEEEE